MTEKQKQQFNSMRTVLIKIHKEYQTTSQLRRSSESEYGLSYEDSLEMAYENIQGAAYHCVKGIKEIK